MQDPVRIALLGGFRVFSGGHSSTRFQSQQTGALLAYLAYFLNQPHPREILVDLLWPEAELDSGLSRLKNLLWLLKQELNADIPLFITNRSTIQLDPELVAIDTCEFFQAWTRAQKAGDSAEEIAALTGAVELLQGELLPGRWEEWVLRERQRVQDLGIKARVMLARSLAGTGHPEAAIPHVIAAVETDPMREDSHAELMQLYAAVGKPQEALRQYRELERILWEEIGEEPSSALQALEERFRTLPVGAVMEAIPTVTRERPISTVAEPVGGAVPLTSALYIERESDPIFLDAVSRGESVVLVKGPRQVGKTSLLARAMAHARTTGMTVLSTDLQKINLSQLETIEGFYRACAEMMAEQLEIESASIGSIGTKAGPNIDFERFIRREILAGRDTHLFWALDEVDRLLAYDYRSEVFGLIRSWHNDRALKPDAPWLRLTLGVAYATEAHLLISDLNQSPFNVGVTVVLRDFSLAEVAELNRRYGAPLSNPAEVHRFYDLFGGVPYLVRRGLYELVTAGLSMEELAERRTGDRAPFHDHLQRVYDLVRADPDLLECARGVLRGVACTDYKSFLRLRSAGVFAGDEPSTASFRCMLYRDFLMDRLAELL